LEPESKVDSVKRHRIYRGVYIDLDYAKRLLEYEKWGWSPDCIIQELSFDSNVFTLDILNRGCTGNVKVTVSNEGNGKALRSWNKIVHFEAGESRTIKIETPGISKNDDTTIKINSRVDEVYCDFKKDDWGRM